MHERSVSNRDGEKVLGPFIDFTSSTVCKWAEGFLLSASNSLTPPGTDVSEATGEGRGSKMSNASPAEASSAAPVLEQDSWNGSQSIHDTHKYKCVRSGQVLTAS